MKTRILTPAFFMLFGLMALAQNFQKEVQFNNDIYHDLNVTAIEDGSEDIIVAGNIFDPSMTQSKISLKRMDQNGAVLWSKTYSDNSLQNARVLDVVNLYDQIILTGYVEMSGTKHTFIAKVEAATGNVLAEKFYNVVSSNFNSIGFNIIYTNSDATGNNQPDPGFVVGGYFGSCYSLDFQCALNIGYVLRVDQNLNVIWTAELDTSVNATADYDFVNKITETDAGFFLTGSASAVVPQGERQGVLAYHIDNEGNLLWNSSYVYGNSRDVSVDAYQEPTTGNIFMLSNYSSTHNFGITVFDINGNIINNLSWAINSPDLNRYGFSLKESIADYNNLVVFGYDRDETWTDANNNSVTGQSNVFVYEFEKATGNPVTTNYQFLTPHTETAGDDLNFWNGQMPLIYYPDMVTVLYDNSGAGTDYVTVGYYSPVNGGGTMAEITRTSTKMNNCDNKEINLPYMGISVTPIPTGSGLVTTTDGPLNFAPANYSVNLFDCVATLGMENIQNTTGGVFPNPVHGELTVYLEDGTLKSVAIYSVLGQKAVSQNLPGNRAEATIDVSPLQPGIYFIEITDSNHRKQTVKFIKK